MQYSTFIIENTAVTLHNWFMRLLPHELNMGRRESAHKPYLYSAYCTFHIYLKKKKSSIVCAVVLRDGKMWKGMKIIRYNYLAQD